MGGWIRGLKILVKFALTGIDVTPVCVGRVTTHHVKRGPHGPWCSVLVGESMSGTIGKVSVWSFDRCIGSRETQKLDGAVTVSVLPAPAFPPRRRCPIP